MHVSKVHHVEMDYEELQDASIREESNNFREQSSSLSNASNKIGDGNNPKLDIQEENKPSFPELQNTESTNGPLEKQSSNLSDISNNIKDGINLKLDTQQENKLSYMHCYAKYWFH